jgi:putative lipoic acid-binding regulatory protein
MRRPNLRIIDIEKREDSQLKGPVNIFNKIIGENFPNLKKEMTRKIQEANKTPNRLDQKRNSSCHIIVKTPNAQNKEIILKAVRGKDQVSYKGRPIKIIPDSSQETMKARRSWADLIQTRRKNKCHPMLLYPSKFSITIEGETKIFHDKTIYTISFHKPSHKMDGKRIEATQGRKLHPRISKKLVFFQQTQKKITT